MRLSSRQTSRLTRSSSRARTPTANELEIELVEGDLLAGIAGPFDLIVSNPPYVGADELDGLEPEVRDWEPRGALVDEGQTVRLARAAQSVLDGWLVVEVHEERAQALSDDLAKLGYAHDQCRP